MSLVQSLYLPFAHLTDQAAEQILRSPPNGFSWLRSREEEWRRPLALLIQISSVVFAILAVQILWTHPWLVFSSFGVGAFVRLEQPTRDGLDQWAHSFHEKVIQPIQLHESPSSKLVLTLFSTCLTLSLVRSAILPVAIGLKLGQYARDHLEQSELASSPAVAQSSVAPAP